MNNLSMTGAFFVTLALVSYSISILTEQVKSRISTRVLVFISLGVSLDVTATVFMILGSRNSPFTFHGSMGYSALLLMVVECSLLWRLFARKGMHAQVPARLHNYSLIAYIWWVIAFITGSLLALT